MKKIKLKNGYEIEEFKDAYDNNLLLLKYNDTIQSASFTDERKYLLYDKYTMFYDTPNVIDNIKSTLVLGGGTFSYPKYYISKYPDKLMDVVEINKELIDISYNHFFLLDLYNEYDQNKERLIIINDDLNNYIFNASKKYDYIFFDAYKGHEIVSTIYEKKTIKRIKELLNQNGYFAINYVKNSDEKYNKIIKILKEYFLNIKEFSIKENDNFIYILASDKKIKSEEFIER